MAMNDPISAPAKNAAKERYVPGSGQTHRHVLVVLVNNQPGVLNRVSSMVRSRNFNIESLAVGHTERPDISRMTVTLRGDDFAVEQMGKQLYRLIDVLKVQDLPESGVVEHELALIKVRATEHKRSEILRVIDSVQLTDTSKVAAPVNIARRWPESVQTTSSSRRGQPRSCGACLRLVLCRLR